MEARGMRRFACTAAILAIVVVLAGVFSSGASGRRSVTIAREVLMPRRVEEPAPAAV